MKCTHVCADQTTYLFLIEPDFPSIADEIAEPRPDMNIKVAAFTVSKKSINTVFNPLEKNGIFHKAAYNKDRMGLGHCTEGIVVLSLEFKFAFNEQCRY